MKTFRNIIFFSILTCSIVACGGAKKEENADEKSSANAFEALSDMGKEMEKVSNKMKERRAKGDTLAMPYADLQKFLPSSINDYKTSEPSGASINMTGMSYSSAEVKYKNDKDGWIKISIIDYNQAYGLYSAASAMWAMGISVDTPEEKANGIKLDDQIGGWEVFKKKHNKANITLGVGERFWVNVEANEQTNTELVKSIAKSIDLAKLASL